MKGIWVDCKNNLLYFEELYEVYKKVGLTKTHPTLNSYYLAYQSHDGNFGYAVYDTDIHGGLCYMKETYITDYYLPRFVQMDRAKKFSLLKNALYCAFLYINIYNFY